MKVVITGNKGMLGRDLVERLWNAGFDLIGVDIGELDITRLDNVLDCLKSFDPDLVINCAAYTAVDKAESEPELAFAVNSDGPAHLAHACARLKSPLIHISTDYVFDGNAKKPYCEDDPVNPLGVYGQSKWKGEEAVRLRLKEHLIVRTSWLYGVHGYNFVKTMLRLAREKDEVKVVNDQHGCPTWTGDLSNTLVKLVNRISHDRSGIPWGTYHFCGRGSTTWYSFAKAIIEESKKKEHLSVTQISPIATEDYPTPVKRPKWSVLDCRKVESTFQIRPKEWRKGLLAMLKKLSTAID